MIAQNGKTCITKDVRKQLNLSVDDQIVLRRCFQAEGKLYLGTKVHGSKFTHKSRPS